MFARYPQVEMVLHGLLQNSALATASPKDLVERAIAIDKELRVAQERMYEEEERLSKERRRRRTTSAWSRRGRLCARAARPSD